MVKSISGDLSPLRVLMMIGEKPSPRRVGDTRHCRAQALDGDRHHSRTARVVRRKRTASAFDQRYAKLVFELLDLPAQWRLRDMQHLAAHVKFRSRATAAKYRSWRSSRTIPPR